MEMCDKIRITVLIFLIVGRVKYGNCLDNVGGPIVNTTLGQVRGVPATDGDYISFLGIPFARVDPTNPFGPALSQPTFEGIFDANDDTAICPQEEEFNHTIVGTLDCLHLNIFVPTSASPTNPRPVFVYLYGGSFEIGFFGRFLYGPKYLVRHDIIVVILNYRVGPYGFMCTDSPLIPGNEGLKDQLRALRWIKENIASFGGDPENISFGGNSAGSISVDLHIRRKSSEILFQKGILQSGTAIVIRSSVRQNDGPMALAQRLGYQPSNITDAIGFLVLVDPLTVIKTVIDMDMPFGVCVEQTFEGVEAFVTDDWRINTNIPGIRNMPILIGFNKDEEATNFRFGIKNPNLFNDILSEAFDVHHKDFSIMSDIMHKFYIGDEALSDNMALNASKFSSDFSFIYPTYRTIRIFLNNNPGNIYLYQFSYAGQRNFIKHKNNFTFATAVHADELGYLFDVSYMYETSPKDQLVVDRMTELWANFVKYGNPTPSTSELLPYRWEAITKGSPQHFMDISEQLTVGTNANHDRMTFWDLFYDTNENYRIDIL